MKTPDNQIQSKENNPKSKIEECILELQKNIDLITNLHKPNFDKIDSPEGFFINYKDLKELETVAVKLRDIISGNNPIFSGTKKSLENLLTEQNLKNNTTLITKIVNSAYNLNNLQKIIIEIFEVNNDLVGDIFEDIHNAKKSKTKEEFLKHGGIYDKLKIIYELFNQSINSSLKSLKASLEKVLINLNNN